MGKSQICIVCGQRKDISQFPPGSKVRVCAQCREKIAVDPEDRSSASGKAEENALGYQAHLAYRSQKNIDVAQTARPVKTKKSQSKQGRRPSPKSTERAFLARSSATDLASQKKLSEQRKALQQKSTQPALRTKEIHQKTTHSALFAKTAATAPNGRKPATIKTEKTSIPASIKQRTAEDIKRENALLNMSIWTQAPPPPPEKETKTKVPLSILGLLFSIFA